MKENKFLVIPFIASIVLAVLFLATQIPVIQATPKQLPIALVNKANPALTEQLQQHAPDTVSFISYDTVEQMQEAMDERQIYGGLAIPKSFDQLTLYSNEGLNPSIIPMVETMLQDIAKQLNATVSAQLLATMPTVPTAQLDALLQPLPVQLQKVNATNGLANVPNALFTAVWITSLLGAVLFYKASTTTKQRQVAQSFLPIAYSFFTGFVITFVASWMLNFQFPSFTNVALVVSIAVLGFSYMILATLHWLKFPSVAIFALLLFFGMPLIQLAPEMLSPFYRDWVLPWLPMRFFIEGLKELLFFNGAVINAYTSTLLAIAGTGLVIILGKIAIKKS